MSDQLTSWLRTVVPTLWAALIAWLVSFGLPDSVVAALSGLGTTAIVPLVLAGVYALLRWLEPRLPRWLTVLLLGSNRPPSYTPPPQPETPPQPEEPRISLPSQDFSRIGLHTRRDPPP